MAKKFMGGFFRSRRKSSLASKSSANIRDASAADCAAICEIYKDRKSVV